MPLLIDILPGSLFMWRTIESDVKLLLVAVMKFVRRLPVP